MGKVAHNESVNSYTNDAWTTLTDSPGVFQTIMLANTGSVDVSCEVRLAETSGPVHLFQILPPTVISPTDPPQVLNISSITVLTGQEIQVRFDAAGMEALISGAIDS